MFLKLYGSVNKTVQCLLDIWCSMFYFSVSFLVKLFKAPFCVVADKEKQAIVIVIRGTMSFKVRLPLYTYIRICVYMYICMCMYMYMYIYMYIYICMYMYLERLRENVSV